MKKNAMLKIAAILLVAVLLTTCAISTTFAKYASDIDDAETGARVAKWGLGLVDDSSELFAASYSGANGVLVLSANGTDKVVAPGTKNANGINVQVAEGAAPEVAYKLTATAEVELTKWTVEGEDYCPIVFTVNEKDYKVGADGITNVADLADKVEAAILAGLLGKADADEDGIVEYAPNEECGTELTVTWSWPDVTANDEKDTALGDAADAAISIAYTLKAEQIIDNAGATPTV